MPITLLALVAILLSPRFAPLFALGAIGATMGVFVLSLAVSPPRCPRCGGPLQYVFTLGADILGGTTAKQRSLSLLTCRALKCRMESHTAVDDSALVFVVHAPSARVSRKSELDSPMERRGLTLGPLAIDVHHETNVIMSSSKVGGVPGFIGTWGEDEADAIAKKGGGFFFQWSEEIYPSGMKTGSLPFMNGVVYVFSRFIDGVPTLDDVVGIWQNT